MKMSLLANSGIFTVMFMKMDKSLRNKSKYSLQNDHTDEATGLWNISNYFDN